MSHRSPLILGADGLPQQLQAADNLTLPGPIATAPAAGSTAIGTRVLAGAEAMTMRSQTGYERSVQSAMARLSIARWCPVPGTTNITLDGANALTTVGTAYAKSPTTTNRATRARRIGYDSSATLNAVTGSAGALAGFYSTSPLWTLGTGATGLGGFVATIIFIPSDNQAASGARMFVGMSSNVSAPTNVEPNTLANSIGVAQLSTSTNMQIVYGGSTAQTAIDLGTNFPANGLDTDLYELILAAEPYDTTIGYNLTRLSTGQMTSGVITNTTPGTTLPATTTLLAPRGWRCSNASTSVVGIDLCGMTIEADA